jgi:hypothetical protein
VELLTQFRQSLVGHYETQLMKDTQMLPNGLSDDLKDLKDSPECSTLIRVLSEWMVLIELSKDLLMRMEKYELSI